MSSWQKTIIVGHVGADPRLDVLKDGTQVASFSVAVSERWRDGDQAKERTTWFKIAVWRDQAAHVAKYVKKGSRVLVEGRVDCEAYQDKAGRPAASLKITASDVRFMSKVEADDSVSPDD